MNKKDPSKEITGSHIFLVHAIQRGDDPFGPVERRTRHSPHTCGEGNQH